jgi:hypothetical protein
LKSLFDGTYETDAEQHDNRAEFAGGTLRGMATAGAGVQIRLSKNYHYKLKIKLLFQVMT